MKIAVRYYTRSGNTERLAAAIAQAAGVKEADISHPLDQKADVVFLGCSYYAFDMDEAVKRFVHENKNNIGRIVCFGTSAMMKSMIKPMKKVTDAAGVQLAMEEFHCRGSFGPMHKGRPNEADLRAAAKFAEKMIRMMS